MISVAIVEDDPQIRQSIHLYLDQQSDMVMGPMVSSVEAILGYIAEATILPDVILMDIVLSGISGIEGIKLIKDRYPDIDIIMLTVSDDPDIIFRCLCAGSTGYLLKNTPLAEIKNSIEMLAHGGSPMSPQIARKVIDHFDLSHTPKYNYSPLSQKEKEILVALIDELSHELVADRVELSIDTVRFHIKNIYKKLHLRYKSEVTTKNISREI